MGRYWVTRGAQRLANDEWLTPPWLLDLLGPFDLDPCSPAERPWDTAQRCIVLPEDGLACEWDGRVWLNPPFGKGLDNWVSKLAAHGDGIAILPLRSTNTKWFHEAIWDAASAVLFARGRIKFCSVEGVEAGPCPHASLLVAYGKHNARQLKRAAGDVTRSFLSRGKFIQMERPD